MKVVGTGRQERGGAEKGRGCPTPIYSFLLDSDACKDTSQSKHTYFPSRVLLSPT